MSISSKLFWPTSATHSTPVWRSKLQRQGLRRPERIDLGAVLRAGAVRRCSVDCRQRDCRWRRPGCHTAAPPGCWSTSMRSILPSRRCGFCAVLLRIAATAAVAEAEVQESVRPEREVAAIVVAERLVDRQQHALGIRIERQAAVRTREFRGDRTDRSTDRCAVIDVGAAIRGEVRMEGHAQQTRLAAVENAAADIEECLGRVDGGVVVECADQAACSSTNQRDASPGACSIATGEENVRFGNARGVDSVEFPCRGRARGRSCCSGAGRGPSLAAAVVVGAADSMPPPPPPQPSSSRANKTGSSARSEHVHSRTEARMRGTLRLVAVSRQLKVARRRASRADSGRPRPAPGSA